MSQTLAAGSRGVWVSVTVTSSRIAGGHPRRTELLLPDRLVAPRRGGASCQQAMRHGVVEGAAGPLAECGEEVGPRLEAELVELIAGALAEAVGRRAESRPSRSSASCPSRRHEDFAGKYKACANSNAVPTFPKGFSARQVHRKIERLTKSVNTIPAPK